MMVDVFFFLKPHIQSIATINGFFPTQSCSSIAFFIELNHWSFGFPGISVSKASACNAGDLGSTPGLGRFPWRRERLPTPVFLGFPDGSAGRESACNAGDLGSTPGLGRSPGEGKGYPLQYTGLEISVDIVHGVSKSRMWLSDIHFHWSLKPKLKCFFSFTYWLKNQSF